MKIICSNFLLLFLLFSCQNDPKNEQKADDKTSSATSIYQMEIYEKTFDDFKVIYLNKLTGAINVRDYNGNWYNAQDMGNLPAYKSPSYSMKIFNGPDKQFQIALSNDVTGEIFIRSYSNSWYEASKK